jgi:SAM-dependent methyltransferase
MGNFGLYSEYYDLLYKDKDYASEVSYVCGLLDRHAQGAQGRNILELGSGTGVHAELMALRGCEVHGVELSPNMLEAAKRRGLASLGKLQFHLGDARNYRTGQCFDAVISLFHVLSYQVSREDILAMMETASVHLQSGGLFLFDFWYGPAVLWQRPGLRVKRLENSLVSVTRIAEPVMHEMSNVVDVHYTVFAEDLRDNRIEKLEETHRMRYFFLEELDGYLREAGMARVLAEEWLTGAQPSLDTWGVTVVARKV